MFERAVQEMLYKKARSPADLPWHSEEPPKLLVDAVARRQRPGRILDLGCGAGVYSVYLARQGHEVTAVDFIPRALEMARARAEAAGVRIHWVHADLLAWQPPDQYDLVLDSGCLHTIRSRHLARYKSQLLSWLLPGGDFILAHFSKRHAFDWRPIGPRRRSRGALVRLFAPELGERAYESQIMTGIPLPIGPTVLGQCFWFQRGE